MNRNTEAISYLEIKAFLAIYNSIMEDSYFHLLAFKGDAALTEDRCYDAAPEIFAGGQGPTGISKAPHLYLLPDCPHTALHTISTASPLIPSARSRWQAGSSTRTGIQSPLNSVSRIGSCSSKMWINYAPSGEVFLAGTATGLIYEEAGRTMNIFKGNT